VRGGPYCDKILGLNEPISRRDFLDGVLLSSAGLLAGAACPFPLGAQSPGTPKGEWAGYTGEGDYKDSAGNTEQVIENAHSVRDGKYDRPPTEVNETGEVYACVVVGGGFAGMSAGLFFHQRGGKLATASSWTTRTSSVASPKCSLLTSLSPRPAGSDFSIQLESSESRSERIGPQNGRTCSSCF
jgi:hypothetical protein